jgi:hypothetical protein
MGALLPTAWRRLDDAEFERLWALASTQPIETIPARTYRIPASFDSRAPEAQRLLAEFHATLLQIFRDCLPVGRKLYALDYHHPSYEFDPHVPFDPGSVWPVSVLPEGDDTTYVSEDRAIGTGSTWDPPTLTFFGTPLLDRLVRARPGLLEGFR